MLPFVQNMSTNQSSSSSAPPRGSTPLHQQVTGIPPNMFPNPLQMQPQMGFINPQLSNPYNNNNSNSSNNGYNLNMGNVGRPPGFMGMPNFNALQQQFQPQPGFSLQNFGQNPGFSGNGQFGGWQNQGQNMNQLGGVMLNPAQVAALSQLLGCVNQVAQGMVPQNPAFLGNPQLGLVQPNAGLQQQQGNFGQQVPVASQQLQNVPPMPFAPALTLPHNNQSQNLQNQGNYGKKQGMHNANGRHNQNKNFTKNPGREASNWRSPNSKPQQMNKGRKESQSAGSENSANQTKSGKQRPLVQLYSEKEIQKWREERKKNYPTKDIVQKKLLQKQANADAAAEEAKLRRQQLKEVLAKQVELGFEVPEIPSHYLSDDEGLVNKRGRNKRPLNNGRHQNRFNKRGRFDRSNRFPSNRGTEDNNGPHNHFSTKPKEENKNGSKACIKEPSLLEKLLSTDMKRDKSRLLQAFRFMVMNSFFTDPTEEKPLNFPKVIVEERGDGGNEEESSFKELNNMIEAHGGCQEEGEITD
ncbi:hypothetical protein RND81_04G180800 [Saponaria officinalis]|uniref:FMR1-interacting protein 1 conserved domain-containing protein n=1 Tax=Saponaria officinalis TaxID=3572 RepID=A0AAW1LPB1_SAPOF